MAVTGGKLSSDDRGRSSTLQGPATASTAVLVKNAPGNTTKGVGLKTSNAGHPNHVKQARARRFGDCCI